MTTTTCCERLLQCRLALEEKFPAAGRDVFPLIGEYYQAHDIIRVVKEEPPFHLSSSDQFPTIPFSLAAFRLFVPPSCKIDDWKWTRLTTNLRDCFVVNDHGWLVVNRNRALGDTILLVHTWGNTWAVVGLTEQDHQQVATLLRDFSATKLDLCPLVYS